MDLAVDSEVDTVVAPVDTLRLVDQVDIPHRVCLLLATVLLHRVMVHHHKVTAPHLPNPQE